MHVSRCEFVKACFSALIGIRAGATVLTTAGSGLDAAANALSAGPISLQSATAGLFRPFINSTFVVTSADGRAGILALAKVTERPSSRMAEQFSLLLHGSATGPLADGTYRFQHPALGKMDLFINKVGSEDPLRARYQACFGRLQIDRPVVGESIPA